MKARLVKKLLAPLAGLVGALLLLGALFHSAPFRHFLADYLAEKIHGETGQRVSFGNFRLGLLLDLQAEGVIFTNEKGDWLRLETARIHWSPKALLRGELRINQLALDGVSLAQIPHQPREKGEAAPRPPKPSKRLPMRILDLRVTRCDLGPYAPLPVSLNFKGELSFDPAEMRLFADLFAAKSENSEGVSQVQLWLTRAGDNVEATLQAREQGRGPVSEFLGSEATNRAELTINALGSKEDWKAMMKRDLREEHQITGTIAIQGENFLPVWDWWRRWIGPEVDASSEFGLSPDGTLLLRQLQGVSSRLNVEGEADLWPGFSLREGTFNFSFNDLAPLREKFNVPVHGALAGHLTYQNRKHRQKTVVQLCSPKLTYAENEIDQFTGSFTLDGPWDEVEGELAFEFETLAIPASLGSRFHIHKETDTLQIPEIHLGLGPHQVRGSGSLGLESRLLAMDFQARRQSLEGWEAIFGKRVEGVFDLEGKVFTEIVNGLPSHSLKIKAKGQQLFMAGVKTPSIEVAGIFHDLTHHPSGTLSLHSHDITGKTWAIHRLQCHSSLAPDGSWTYDFSTQGERHFPFNLQLGGKVQRLDQNWVATIQNFSGKVYERDFSLIDHASLQAGSQGVYLSPLVMRFGHGGLMATMEWKDRHIRANLGLRELPLDLFNAAHPITPLTGSLSGSLKVEGMDHNPQADLQLHIQDFRLVEPGFEHASTINGTFQASLRDSRARLDLQLHGFGRSPLRLQGEVPLSLSLNPLRAHLDTRHQPLDLALEAQGFVGSVIHLFVPDTHRFSGTFDAKLHMVGTMAEPQMEGYIHVTNGEYQSLHTASLLRNLNATLEAEGNTLRLQHLSADDARKGRLKASGELTLSKSRHYPFLISSKLRRCTLVDKDHLQAVFDGEVELTGNTRGGELTGSLEVVEADLSIPEDMTHKVPALELTYINQPPDAPLPLSTSKDQSWPLKLNLQVKADSQIFVRGRGLSSEWEGKAKVQGTTENPSLYGDLRLTRGDFIFVGRAFVIKQGEIHFDGPVTKNTTLSITALLSLPQFEVEAILSGAVREPTLQLKSNPSAPLKEILARMLFEKGLNDISPLQGLELAQTVLALTNGTPDPVGALRKNIGLDRLDISHSPENANDISLHAGKYIAPGVFLSLNKSFSSGSDSVSLEMRLSDHIKAEGHVSAGAGSSSKFSLKWKKDY